MVEGVLAQQRTIDPMVDEALTAGWPLRRVELVMRAALRAGAFELIGKPETPARVVIAEYVNVAAAFFEREETGMVNAFWIPSPASCAPRSSPEAPLRLRSCPDRIRASTGAGTCARARTILF